VNVIKLQQVSNYPFKRLPLLYCNVANFFRVGLISAFSLSRHTKGLLLIENDHYIPAPPQDAGFSQSRKG
jgi:hypothetical protein